MAVQKVQEAMRVEMMTNPLASTTAPLSASMTTTQPLLPAVSTIPTIPPLVGLTATTSSSAMLALPAAISSSPTVFTAHSSTAPLPAPQLKLSYEQLMANYQQVCSERDAFASQVEKMKEKALALSVDTAITTATHASPRSHHLAAFSPTASASLADSASSSDAASTSGPSEAASTLQSLRDKHGLIQSTIATIQHKTARILHDQERELIRAFRLRLTTLTAELEAERQRSASGSAEWVSRCKRLSEEMEWLRGLVEQLGEENKGLSKDVRRMRKAMRVQERTGSFL